MCSRRLNKGVPLLLTSEWPIYSLALINAFFVSLNALNTGLNLCWSMLALSLIGSSNCVWLGLPLLRPTPNWKEQSKTAVVLSLLAL
jgi:hypothetical protein